MIYRSPYLADFPVHAVCTEDGCEHPATRLLVMVEALPELPEEGANEITVRFFCDTCADLRHVEWKEEHDA